MVAVKFTKIPKMFCYPLVFICRSQSLLKRVKALVKDSALGLTCY